MIVEESLASSEVAHAQRQVDHPLPEDGKQPLTEQRVESDSPQVVDVPKHLVNRILYTNPVCFLSVRDAATGRKNVMTISWLTPTDNHGGVFLSVNAKRHTATFLRKASAVFCLSVATQGMEEMLLAVGGCSGRDAADSREAATGLSSGPSSAAASPVSSAEESTTTLRGIGGAIKDGAGAAGLAGASLGDDKFAQLHLPFGRPGEWVAAESSGEAQRADLGGGARRQAGSVDDAAPERSRERDPRRPASAKQLEKEEALRARHQAIAVTGATAAHVLLRVVKLDEGAVEGHLALYCKALGAWVKSEYWNGTIFRPRATDHAGRSPIAPPTLSFFGSKTFGLVH